MVIDAEKIVYELRNTFNVSDVDGPNDRTIYLPELGWLKEFGRWVAENSPGYVDEAFDCEDFARFAQLQASLAWIKSPRSRKAGHSVFSASVVVQSHDFWDGVATEFAQGHALNMVMTSDAGWHFMEPQTGKTIPHEQAHPITYDGPIVGIRRVRM